MINSITLSSPAKVNLGLHILGKQSDGYHLLETLYYPVHELADEITVERMEGEDCEIVMEQFDEALILEENLCFKAWKKLQHSTEKLDAGVRIKVKKQIPAGAGLGGGSSNAATVLLALNKLWELGLEQEKLAEIGTSLGADVPFFIYQKPMYGTGTGTDLDEFSIDLSKYELRLKLLPVHSSTVEAYKGLDITKIQHPNPLYKVLSRPVRQWKYHLFNDLEENVFARLPEVAAAKKRLYLDGAEYAAMSGSGSACFGLFER